MAKKSAATRHNKEGRVNVPLGIHQKALESMAIQYGLSKTRLARTILVDGLEKLLSGAVTIKGPEISPQGGSK